MNLRYFKLEDFACKGQNCCGGSNRIDTVFVEELDQLRHELGFPLVVSSGYRCPVHNARVSSTGANGPHVSGRACDLVVDRGKAYQVTKLAFAKGFTGIGWQQKGASRFVHLDTLPNTPAHPRPTVWSYP